MPSLMPQKCWPSHRVRLHDVGEGTELASRSWGGLCTFSRSAILGLTMHC